LQVFKNTALVSTPPKMPHTYSYTVISGDTLGAIAAPFDATVTPQTILDENKGRYPKMTLDHIEVGWVLTMTSAK
jgi:hypothetical protein